MKSFRVIVCLLLSFLGYAQEEVVHSVYFDFDKFNIRQDQQEHIQKFVTTLDSTKIESISILGYTDDRGKDEYNFKLSTNRANSIKDYLVEQGIKNKIIVSIEGKGRILIDDDVEENLPEARSKNRRVDVVVYLKKVEEEVILMPGIYETITKDNIVGDRIYLKNLLFDRGSSELTIQSKKELDKIAKLLNKYKNYHFEIQGHVCCTPPYHKEAIDRGTRKRELSKNRAESVYKYLISKKVSKYRMTFKGYGTSKPLGQDPRFDRRVEFLITKS